MGLRSQNWFRTLDFRIKEHLVDWRKTTLMSSIGQCVKRAFRSTGITRSILCRGAATARVDRDGTSSGNRHYLFG